MVLFYGIQISTTNPSDAQAITNEAVASITTYFINNIGNWIVEEVFGTLIGAVVGAFTGLFN